MTNTTTRNDDDMTRYREKTRRGLIIYLANEGPTPLKDIAQDLEKDERVIRNYLRHFEEDFEAVGSGKGAKWKTQRVVVANGGRVLII